MTSIIRVTAPQFTSESTVWRERYEPTILLGLTEQRHWIGSHRGVHGMGLPIVMMWIVWTMQALFGNYMACHVLLLLLLLS
jgi:hypothetical protein